MDPKDFNAEGMRARLQQKRDAERAEEKASRVFTATQQQALRDAFESREVPPDALERVMRMVERAIEGGNKEALVFRFPSDYMDDSGRSLTSGIGDWTQRLTGAASRAYAFFKSELEPRGFSLVARIVEYKEGMPGDVGFFLVWAKS
jgi:hypothetical protein